MHSVNVLPQRALLGQPDPRCYGAPLAANPALPAPEPDPGEVASALVRRILAGEPGAEAELVERYHGGLLLLLRHRTRDPETAEDLCQETLRLAIEKIRNGEVREPDRLAAFLRSLATNQSIQLYRRTGERSDLREEIGLSCELPDAQPSALAMLLQNEKARLARQVLQDLGTERDRQVLLRYYLAEERAEAICRDLGLTSEHFYRVLHRARQRYRRLFEEQIEETK